MSSRVIEDGVIRIPILSSQIHLQDADTENIGPARNSQQLQNFRGLNPIANFVENEIANPFAAIAQNFQ